MSLLSTRRPATTPRCVEKTLSAAGFWTGPYHALVPSFGEWGYVLAGKRSPVPARPLPLGLRFIDEATLAGTLTLDRITGIASSAGAKVLLVGDWAQLQSNTNSPQEWVFRYCGTAATSLPLGESRITRCAGIQPESPPTQPVASSASRNACFRNG